MTLRYEKTAFYPVAEGERLRKDKLGRKGGWASEFVGKVVFTVGRLAEKFTGFPGQDWPTVAWQQEANTSSCMGLGWGGWWGHKVSMARPELQVPRDTACSRTRS